MVDHVRTGGSQHRVGAPGGEPAGAEPFRTSPWPAKAFSDARDEDGTASSDSLSWHRLTADDILPDEPADPEIVAALDWAETHWQDILLKD